MERLNDKKIIVTGGASGMGGALVEVFPSLGAKVVSFDMNDELGNPLAKRHGAMYLHVDVSSEKSVNTGVAQAAEHMGGLDVLIHAAAISPRVAAEDLTLDDWNLMMNVNSTGTFLMNKAVFPYMKDKGGHIINIASSAALDGYPSKCAYAASKGAVISWSRSLAMAWMKYKIQVNVITPAIWTPMYEKTRSLMLPAELEAHEKKNKSQMIDGKMGDPIKDFAPVMAFLASDSSRFMSGQIFQVCGVASISR